MALLYMESFDYSNVFPTTTTANFENILKRKLFDFVDLTTFEDGFAVAGAHGGTALQFGHENQFIRTRNLRVGTTNSQGFVGFRMKMHNNFDLLSNDDFFHIYVGGVIQLSFRINNTGSVSAYRGNTTLLETSPTFLFFPNMGWQYIEIRFDIHDSTGAWQFKRDGTVIWTSGSYDTRASTEGYWDRIQFGLGAIARDTILDDIYINDASGAQNNNYLGDTVVELIHPSADGDSSQWTPSSGTNHSALVDEAQAMTDALDETDHIEGDATTEKDLFQYENLASPGLADASALFAVMVTTYRRITAEQPIDLKVVAKTGITEGTVTHTVRHDQITDMFNDFSVFELDPDTAAAWTPSGVDGAQFGVEVV